MTPPSSYAAHLASEADELNVLRRRIALLVYVSVPAAIILGLADLQSRGVLTATLTGSLVIFLLVVQLFVNRAQTWRGVYRGGIILAVVAQVFLVVQTCFDLLAVPIRYGSPYWMAVPIMAAAVILGVRPAMYVTLVGVVGLIGSAWYFGLAEPWNWLDVTRRIVFLVAIWAISATARRITDRQYFAVAEQRKLLADQAEQLEQAVTQREHARAQLADHLVHVLRAAPDGIIEYSSNGTVRGVNVAGDRILGVHPPGEGHLAGQSLPQVLHQRSALEVHRALPEAVSRVTMVWDTALFEPGRRFEATLDVGGDIIETEWAVTSRDAGGETILMAAVRDISEQKRLERSLYHQANFDSSTELPNENFLREHLELLMVDANGERPLSGMVVVNLDDYGSIRDSLGLEASRELVRAVGERISSSVPEGELLAFLGGDTFAIVCNGLTGQPATIARDVQAVLRAPFTVRGSRLTVTACMGVVFADGSRHGADDFLRDASAAMSIAKTRGRGTIIVFDDSIRANLVDRLTLDMALHRAAASHEFSLAYQPIVDADTGHIASAEAWLRWNSADRGFVSPGQFIPRLEATGLIGEVGRWIMNQAFADLARWQQTARLGNPSAVAPCISINVSVQQLINDQFVNDVITAARVAGVESDTVILEITESEYFSHDAPVGALMADLKDAGFKIAIDDFGTGYSSLGQLRNLSVDALKIDKVFVDRIVHDAADRSIFTGMVELGHLLDLTTVAEGVEHVDQLALVREAGCQRVQGFVFSRPVSFSQLLDMSTRSLHPADAT